ncbi:hypothetical protein [Kitasatospora sp. NRRL B-11411]|uniref:hypothetical protein n=1 Tax=Kitasatospora sp. NRRL B-11411 TaxID=1463822 RepID=UPI0004C2B2E8|nr:hypothetical protein [Kitasatospora sp. NRRL B-11411]
MDFTDSYESWADAHAFYGASLVPTTPDPVDPLGAQKADWTDRLALGTPNGHLLRRNNLFDSLAAGGKLHLLHVTHALEKISKDGSLYPSGGCLVGSIYCAPLTAADQGWRPHNLGSYILTREAPAFLAKIGRPDHQPTPLIFELDLTPQAYQGLAGVDYLRLGSIHLAIYTQLEYLLSKAERNQLRETVVSRVKNSAAFLALAAAVAYQGAVVEPAGFLRQLDETIPRLPILGYIFFEALSEYAMLHSTSPRTRRLAEIGEFDNWLYKELLFAVPGMIGRFDLARFRVPDLGAALSAVDPTLDADAAALYLTARVSHLVAARLFTPGQVPDRWHHTKWEFDSLAPQLGPLLGHLIHRELRTYGRSPDFYFYFDQLKALQAWNYWNHLDIPVPFNGTIPKGEIGINPAYPDLKYRAWRADSDEAGNLHPTEELDLTITPRLVDLRSTLMRNNQWAPAAA